MHKEPNKTCGHPLGDFRGRECVEVVEWHQRDALVLRAELETARDLTVQMCQLVLQVLEVARPQVHQQTPLLCPLAHVLQTVLRHATVRPHRYQLQQHLVLAETKMEKAEVEKQ